MPPPSKILRACVAMIFSLLSLLAFALLLHGASARSAQAASSARSSDLQATVSITGTEWIPPSPAYRIIVTQNGMHQLTHSALAAAGLPVSTLDPRAFRMFYMGQEIPIQVTGEGDGVFDSGDAIYFYGRTIDSLFYDGLLPTNMYTGENVFWLTYGGVNGLRMTTRDGSVGDPTAYTSVATYWNSDHREINSFYFPNRPWHPWTPMPDRFEPGADRWQWIWLRRYSTTARNFGFGITHLPATGANAQVEVQLLGSYGKTLFNAPDVNHHIRLYMNPALNLPPIYDNPAAGKNYELFTITATVPFTQLVEGNNQLRIELATAQHTLDEVYVNWFRVKYEDSLKAENNRLLFAGQTGSGPWRYTVSNFTGSNVCLYDVTDPLNPQQILVGSQGCAAASNGSNYEIVFGDGAAARQYAAVATDTANGLLSPVRIEPVAPKSSIYTPVNLLDTANGADWIAITHANFWDQAMPLATHRAKRYRVALIDVQQIYDQFNGGLRSSESIREFLRYAYHRWSGPKPRFVLLIGDGNDDMRRYLAGSPETYIPPFLVVSDPTLGVTAADNRYVTLVGDDLLAEMSIGRFPVNTPAEATIMVNKTIGYETTPVLDEWNKRVLFVADNLEGGGGNFYHFSNEIADGYADPNQSPESKFLPDPYEPVKAYLDYNDPVAGCTLPQCRTRIIEQVNNGALFTSYIGHAQVSNWAGEQMLNKSIVDQFTNADRLSIFLAMACYEGSFHLAGRVSLAEQYLLHPNGGAVASWSPTGVSVATGHDYLEKGFFLAVFQNGVKTMGEATDAGKEYLYNERPGYYEDLYDTFLLFGDPALQIQTWLEPTAVDMAGFSVQAQSDEVVVEWATANELQIFGFNVLRSQNEQGPFLPLHDEPQEAYYPGTAQGSHYHFVDRSASPGTPYWYRLEVLKLDGSREQYGLAAINQSLNHSYLYLPHLQK